MSETLIIFMWLAAAAVAFVVARRGAERAQSQTRPVGVPRRQRPARPPEAGARTARRPSETPLVSINSAGVDELCRLPGVGRRAAERLVAHRERAGPFDSLDDLLEVEGFTRDRVRRLSERAKL